MHEDMCPGSRKAKSQRVERHPRKLYAIKLESPEGQRVIFSAAHCLADALDSARPVLDLDHWQITSIKERGEAP